jgi:short-subunit dehydrogenase
MFKSERRYDNKIAVITGASSGIGNALALELARRGATVIGLARREPLLQELAKQLVRTSPASITRVCDVGNTENYRQQLIDIESQFGRIDILINDAGIDIELSAQDGQESTVRTVFDVNFFAVATGTLTVLPGMMERRSGIVVNVSSDTARAPEPRQGAYAASKAAVSVLTDSLSHEAIDRNVFLHVLYPGWVPTAMGLSGATDGDSMPPKMVRRTADGVANLVAERMGRPLVDINAARLPLAAPIFRTVAPRLYVRAIRGFATSS